MTITPGCVMAGSRRMPVADRVGICSRPERRGGAPADVETGLYARMGYVTRTPP